MNKIVISLAVLMLAACATNPDKVASAYVSASEYNGMSCQQLLTAYTINENEASALYSSMKSKSRVNTTAGVVGVVLFWPALFFMKGKDASADAKMSELKGRKTAINKAINLNGC